MAVRVRRVDSDQADGVGASGRYEASGRAQQLAAQLRAAAAGLSAVIQGIAPERWDRVRAPGEWSPGKDAEHAVDAAAMHLWHVYASVGVHQAAGPPAMERARLTATRSQAEIVNQLHTCTEAGARLIEGLSDAQLELPAKPPRRPSRSVADIIARPLIRHLGTHQEEIERKLRARASGSH